MLAYGVSNTQENVMWPEKLWVDFSQGQVLIVGERAEEVEETEERVIEQLGCSNLGNEGNSLWFGNFFSHKIDPNRMHKSLHERKKTCLQNYSCYFDGSENIIA